MSHVCYKRLNIDIEEVSQPAKSKLNYKTQKGYIVRKTH